MIEKQILSRLQLLPERLRREVLDYVTYLVEKNNSGTPPFLHENLCLEVQRASM